MNETDLLLTDEFINFSKEITVVYENKKLVEEDFKKHFEDYKKKKKEFESNVIEANIKWEDWKKTQLSSAKKDNNKNSKATTDPDQLPSP